MIANRQEYYSAKRAIDEFERSLCHIEQSDSEHDLILKKALIESVTSELDVLRHQVTEYEAFTSGQYGTIELYSLADLATALSVARLGRNWSYRQLAECANLDEEIVRRYEDTAYTDAAFKDIVAIAEALSIIVHLTLQVPTRRTAGDVTSVGHDPEP